MPRHRTARRIGIGSDSESDEEASNQPAVVRSKASSHKTLSSIDNRRAKGNLKPREISKRLSNSPDNTQEHQQRKIDVAAKFGATSTVSKTHDHEDLITSENATETLRTNIPSATEIREKKARRARLAAESSGDFIALDEEREQERKTFFPHHRPKKQDEVDSSDSDDAGKKKLRENVQMVPAGYSGPLPDSSKLKKPSRLERDDRDDFEDTLADGTDPGGELQYIIDDDDGYVAKGRIQGDVSSSAARAREERKREIEKAINRAQKVGRGEAAGSNFGAHLDDRDSSEEFSDDNDADNDRTSAYEASQTRAGLYSSRKPSKKNQLSVSSRIPQLPSSKSLPVLPNSFDPALDSLQAATEAAKAELEIAKQRRMQVFQRREQLHKEHTRVSARAEEARLKLEQFDRTQGIDQSNEASEEDKSGTMKTLETNVSDDQVDSISSMRATGGTMGFMASRPAANDLETDDYY